MRSDFLGVVFAQNSAQEEKNEPTESASSEEIANASNLLFLSNGQVFPLLHSWQVSGPLETHCRVVYRLGRRKLNRRNAQTDVKFFRQAVPLEET